MAHTFYIILFIVCLLACTAGLDRVIQKLGNMIEYKADIDTGKITGMDINLHAGAAEKELRLMQEEEASRENEHAWSGKQSAYNRKYQRARLSFGFPEQSEGAAQRSPVCPRKRQPVNSTLRR